MKELLRILFVEDSPDDVLLVARYLQKVGVAADWKQVDSAPAFEEALDTGDWDLVVCDYSVPSFGPHPALRILQRRKLNLPFIVMSGAVEEDRLVEIMHAGAHDLILKHRLERLAPAIERTLADAAMRRERDETAEALRTSEVRYRGIVEDQTEMICRFLPDGALTFVNRAYGEYMGKSPDDLVGQSFFELAPEDYCRVLRLHLQALSAQEPSATHEYRFSGPDGQVNWEQWTIRAFVNAEGEIESYQSVGRDITKLKQTEIELRHQRERLRLITDALPALVAYVDKDRRCTFINKMGASWYGHDRREIVGRAVRDFAGADIYARLTPHMDAVLAGRRVDADEIIAFPDGAVRDIQLTYVPDIEEDSAVRGYYAMLVDVTKSKRAEQAVRDSQARLSGILDSAIEAIISVDADQRISLFNKGAEVIFGYRAEEVLRQPLDILLPESERASHREHLARFLAPENDCSHLTRIRQVTGRRKDGSVFPADVTLSKLRLGDQAIATAMLHDITERKQVEDELRNSEKKYRTILNSTSEGYWLINADRITVDVNPALCAILGYARDEIVGRSPLDFVHQERRQDYAEMLGQIPETAQRSYEMTLMNRSGKEVYAHLFATTLFDDAGACIGSFALVRDETERKRTEQQLRQSQKMEAVGQLTGGVAHDFNNLLSVILGNLQLLERAAKDDERMRKRIDIALQATARGSELTNRLLAFSRRQVLEPRVLRANELIDGLTSMLGRTLGETIQIDRQLSDDLWFVKADPGQLESTLLNLAINARDAMPDGGKLTIETANIVLDEAYQEKHSYTQPGDYVRLTISDTGSGMTAEVLEHVFEPFFTTKGVGKGTGLGLSMAYGFVKQSGGYIEIYSELGWGTSVKIYLPRVARCAPEQPEGLPETDDEEVGVETILVVEDEPQVRETAVTLLEDMGYSVLQAENGQQALEILEREPHIDLLFTDVVMPGGMDGLALAKEVKRRRPEIAVMYASGYTEHAVMNSESLDRGGYWLGKPYPRQQLARKIRQALSGRKAA